VEAGKVAVRETLRNWSMPAYLVKGRIAGESQMGSMVYLEEGHQYYQSWIDRFFADAQPVEALGRLRAADILRLKGVLAEHDLVLCPVNPLTERLFSSCKWLIVPRFINCAIDLRRPVEEMFYSRNTRETIRKLRKFEYTFKALHSELALEEFFHKMLLPTVRKRHKERAYISNLEDLRRLLENGYILAAYRNSEWVGAELVVCQENKILRAANIGWRNGDEQLMKDRLVPALTYELINRARADGFEFLNLGNSLPFVDDGVLNYKLRWGADLEMPRIRYEDGKLLGVTGFVAAKFNLASEKGRAMLHHNPLLVGHKGRVRAVGWNSPLRREFGCQIDRGVQWIDLRKATL